MFPSFLPLAFNVQAVIYIITQNRWCFCRSFFRPSMCLGVLPPHWIHGVSCRSCWCNRSSSACVDVLLPKVDVVFVVPSSGLRHDACPTIPFDRRGIDLAGAADRPRHPPCRCNWSSLASTLLVQLIVLGMCCDMWRRVLICWVWCLVMFLCCGYVNLRNSICPCTACNIIERVLA